jgi:hypothetical protein
VGDPCDQAGQCCSGVCIFSDAGVMTCHCRVAGPCHSTADCCSGLTCSNHKCL